MNALDDHEIEDSPNALKAWAPVLIGPLAGIVASPFLAWPLIRCARYLIWESGNHMPGKNFLGTVSVPLIGAVYAFLFVWFGAFFAPHHRRAAATGLYILGSLAALALLGRFGSPDSNLGGPPRYLWQPVTVTVLAGTAAYLSFLAFEGRHRRDGNSVAAR